VAKPRHNLIIVDLVRPTCAIVWPRAKVALVVFIDRRFPEKQIASISGPEEIIAPADLVTEIKEVMH